jgi:HEAT repeat protein
VVADALLAGEGKLTLAPFVTGREKLDPKLEAQVDETIEGIASALVPGLAALTRHPSVEVRTRVVELLARRPEPEAQAAVVDALSDPEDGVRRAALAAIGPVRSAKLVGAVGKLVKESPSWPLRVRAADALGRLGAGGADGRAAIVETLSAAARGDGYALVREAAVRALVQSDKAAAKAVLEELAQKDPEPRVREAAAELLK